MKNIKEIENIKEDLNLMDNLTKDFYSKAVKELKNEIFGYNTSLDILHNYWKKNNIEDAKSAFSKFSEDIIEIYKNYYDDEADDMNIILMKNYLLSIISYLFLEVPHSDYTFVGIIKIIETFSKSDKKVERTIFYMLINQLSEKDKIKLNELSNNSLNQIMNPDDFDGNKIYTLMQHCWICLKYYLYVNNMDYISDDELAQYVKTSIIDLKNTFHSIYNHKKYPNSLSNRPRHHHQVNKRILISNSRGSTYEKDDD